MSVETIPQSNNTVQDDRFTVDQFFDLIPEGQKADLIDGGIYVASPDRPYHNRIASFLQFLLDGYVSKNDLGEVFVSRVAFELSETDAPEPDVAFVSRDNLGRVGDVKVLGGPDIAVEIVSRDSRKRDRVDKKALYETAGVREYWLIDPLRNLVEFFRLADGQYRVVELQGSRFFKSEVLPGFWLDAEWLLADQPPNRWECMSQIFAGEPAVQDKE